MSDDVIQPHVEAADSVVAPDPASIVSDPAPVVSDAAPTPAPAPHQEQKIPVKIMLERIAREGEKAERERQARLAAEREAAEYKALVERLNKSPENPAPSPIPTYQPPVEDQTQRQAEIQKAATQQRLYEDSLEVRNRGMAEFGQSFVESLSLLSALGATSDEFIADVLAVDKANAHALLEKMAKEPDRVTTLANMSSRARIAELTRMSMAEKSGTGAPATTPLAAPAPKTVSKAPAPAPQVHGSTSKEIDWRSDSASDDDFDKGFWENQKRRSEMRRSGNVRY